MIAPAATEPSKIPRRVSISSLPVQRFLVAPWQGA
jgi:hypothetical protein